MVSIGFGGGEVIQVDRSLNEVRQLLQDALRKHELLQMVARNGQTVVINPEQVKVLQNSGAPESFPPASVPND
jgi:hypothetical protein